MAYRSEANRIANKQNFKDLNLTQYPNTLDTRTSNENMRGFVNIGETEAIPDYVMAEYVNALSDAAMALERTLGKTPMIYHGASQSEVPNIIENFTVADRLTRIEDGLFDVRYGGEGWQNVPDRPVLNNHRHTGKNGQPPQINLTEEVTNLLPYKNIDLNYQTGLTGAQISLSSSNPTKLNEVIADLLSKSQGGRVTGDVTFTGVVKTRTSMDATASDIVNRGQSSLVSDNQATSGRALSSGDTTAQRRVFTINGDEKNHLLFGRYILGVRLKKSRSLDNNTNLLQFDAGDYQELFIDSDVQTDYKTIHFIFEQNHINKNQNLTLTKLSTSNAQEVRVDNYYITPIHPATLDR